MLRYYEEIGLIIPDRIDDNSGYRYYSAETLRDVQAVRYMADAGFSLDEIGECRRGGIAVLKEAFLKNIEKTEATINYQYQRLASLKDWCSLIIEGNTVLSHRGPFHAEIKYIPEQRYFSFRREHPAFEKNADLITEIQYMTSSKQDGHSMIDVGGALTFAYDSYADRMNGSAEAETVYQTIYKNSASLTNTEMNGDFIAVSAYHTGSRRNIASTYENMTAWAEQHKFTLRGDSLERRVIDSYSTTETDKFVTNILLPVRNDSSDMKLMYKFKQEVSTTHPLK